MDQKVKPTPTPWRVEKGTGLIWGDCTLYDDGTPDRLGIPVTDGQLKRPWSKGSGPTYDEMEANAAFIVKAVNNHDRMVKAFEALRDDESVPAWIRTFAAGCLPAAVVTSRQSTSALSEDGE